MSQLNQLQYSYFNPIQKAIRMQKSENKLGKSDKCDSGSWECFKSDGTSDCLDCELAPATIFHLKPTCFDEHSMSCATRHPGTSSNPPGDPAKGCNAGWWPCYDKKTSQKYCKACTSVLSMLGACRQSQDSVCGSDMPPKSNVSALYK